MDPISLLNPHGRGASSFGDAPRPGVCPRFGSGAVEAAPLSPIRRGSGDGNAVPTPGRVSKVWLQELKQKLPNINARNSLKGCQHIFSFYCPLSVEG